MARSAAHRARSREPDARAVGPAPARWSAVFTSEPALPGPPLVLVAHGSTDPRFAAVVEAIAADLRASAPHIDVRVGYLEHGPPHVADVVEPAAVVVPLLLTAGYHVRVDLPAQATDVLVTDALVTDALGPDPRIAAVLAQRLREAGYDGGPVTLAAAGGAGPRAPGGGHPAAGGRPPGGGRAGGPPPCS